MKNQRIRAKLVKGKGRARVVVHKYPLRDMVITDDATRTVRNGKVITLRPQRFRVLRDLDFWEENPASIDAAKRIMTHELYKVIKPEHILFTEEESPYGLRIVGELTVMIPDNENKIH